MYSRSLTIIKGLTNLLILPWEAFIYRISLYTPVKKAPKINERHAHPLQLINLKKINISLINLIKGGAAIFAHNKRNK